MSRRTAILGTTGALLAAATGTAAATTDIAVAGRELVWKANANNALLWDLPSRIVTRLPTSARYGQPILVGPVIVQAICPPDVVSKIRRTHIERLSGTGKCTLTATDPRGLTAPVSIDLTFPETPLPETDVEFTMTGTAAITSPLPLPLPRNKGSMRVAIDPTARARLDGWQGNRIIIPAVVGMTLRNDQDPILTTIDIR